MIAESAMEIIVKNYFSGRGWNVSGDVKIRGRTADIVAVKDNEIAVVAVQGGSSSIQGGISQALHQKSAVNFSYLAISKERVTDEVIDVCRNLGVGLLLVDGDVQEVLRPVRGEAFQSVQKLILGSRSKKRLRIISTKGSLERLFRSKALVSILKLLLLNSTQEFHLHEIARRTGLAPSTVVKESRILLGLGLVVKRTQGGLVLYKINRGSVIYEELKRIFMKYELLDEILTEELPAAQIKYALIYGSYAKGTEGVKSDVDMLVVGEVDETVLLKVVSKVQRKVGREVNYLLWTEREFLDKVRRRIPLLKEVSKTPIVMLVGDAAEFKRVIA
jgi:predicted nucleotidyltransferase